MKKIILGIICLLSSQIVSAQYYGNPVIGSGVPTISGCGTGPTLAPESIDGMGKINVGAGILVTSCTLTFSSPTPAIIVTHCTYTVGGVAAGIVLLTESTTDSGFNITFLGNVGGGWIKYWCPSTVIPA